MNDNPSNYELGMDTLLRCSSLRGMIAKATKLLKSSDPNVRRLAVETLGKIADRDCLPSIVNMLRDDSGEVRACAVSALADMPDSQTTQRLMSLTHDTSNDVRAAAVHRIGELCGPSNFPSLVEETLKGFAGDKVLTLNAAARGLGWVHASYTGKEDPNIVPTLIEALGHTNPHVRFAAVKALEKIGDQAAIDALNSVAASDNYVEVSYYTEPVEEHRTQPIRDAARDAIHKIKSRMQLSKPYDELVSTIKDDNEWYVVRAGAVKALAKTPGANAMEVLIGLLDDEGGNFHEEAAKTLGLLGDARAIQRLRALLKPESADHILDASCLSLAKLGASGVDALLHTLAAGNEKVQHHVANALGEAGDKRAVNPLIHAYSSQKGWFAREAILVALGKLGDRSAYGVIRKARLTDNMNEKSAALDAIIMLWKKTPRSEQRGNLWQTCLNALLGRK